MWEHAWERAWEQRGGGGRGGLNPFRAGSRPPGEAPGTKGGRAAAAHSLPLNGAAQGVAPPPRHPSVRYGETEAQSSAGGTVGLQPAKPPHPTGGCALAGWGLSPISLQIRGAPGEARGEVASPCPHRDAERGGGRGARPGRCTPGGSQRRVAGRWAGAASPCPGATGAAERGRQVSAPARWHGGARGGDDAKGAPERFSRSSRGCGHRGQLRGGRTTRSTRGRAHRALGAARLNGWEPQNLRPGGAAMRENRGAPPGPASVSPPSTHIL